MQKWLLSGALFVLKMLEDSICKRFVFCNQMRETSAPAAAIVTLADFAGPSFVLLYSEVKGLSRSTILKHCDCPLSRST
jgi:hypothetical protein